MSKWHRRWLEMAALVASWSKDPSKQIGAVAVRGNRLLAQGYNGLPRDFPDTPEYLANREIKYKFIIHAEENLIINAAKNGVSLQDSDVYVFGLAPCSGCSGKLITAGVRKIFFLDLFNDPHWAEAQARSEIICNHAGVKLIDMMEDNDTSSAYRLPKVEHGGVT